MKKTFLALLAAGILLACSCTSGTADSEGAEEASGANLYTQETVLPEGEETESEIKSILSGEVVDARSGEKVKVSELDSDDDRKTEPERYCVVDLDSDGKNEYLIEYSDFGNTAIVREYEGELYAYMIPFRARQMVKTDGEMMWSDSADCSGTQRAVFSGREMEMVITLESDFYEDVHFVDGKEVSLDEALKAWEKFEAKENAEIVSVYELYE